MALIRAIGASGGSGNVYVVENVQLVSTDDTVINCPFAPKKVYMQGIAGTQNYYNSAFYDADAMVNGTKQVLFYYNKNGTTYSSPTWNDLNGDTAKGCVKSISGNVVTLSKKTNTGYSGLFNVFCYE